MTFYGSSFIADQTGALVVQADRVTEGFHTHAFDLDADCPAARLVGRFPRPASDMYGALMTSDGRHTYSTTKGQ